MTRAPSRLRDFAKLHPGAEAVDFGIVRDDGRYATVLVHVFSAQTDAAYDYVLVKERAGWRIGSVTRHETRRNNNV